MNNRQFAYVVTLAVIVLCLAVGGWSLWGPGSKKQSTVTPDATLDIMKPSPLGEQSQGKDDAPVIIIEYASMSCPHCASFNITVFPELKKQFIDTGKVRFIFREFPHNEVAIVGSMLARCVDKDKYFPMVDVLFRQQERWAAGPPATAVPALQAIAKTTGVSEDSFNACLKDQKILEGIMWSRDNAEKLGVDSVPAFFINGKRYYGGTSIPELEKAIEPLLKQ